MNNNRQKVKRQMIYCEPCGYKQIIEPKENPEDLTVIPTTKIQGHIPQIDPATQKAVQKPFLERPKMYKCPCCGRGVRLKELLLPYAKALDDLDRKREIERLENDKLKRIEDGKPHEKPVLPEGPQFLG